MDRRQERTHRREVLQQELGRTVRDLSEARNLTQQELASKMQRPRQFLTRLEAGVDQKITLDVIEDLGDALEVLTEELLGSFLQRSAKKWGVRVVVPKDDPRLARHRRALYRLSMAAARIPVAEMEALANLIEARAREAKVRRDDVVA